MSLRSLFFLIFAWFSITLMGEAAATYSLNLGGQILDLSQPCIMGILNATPDSFYSGSRMQTEADIVQRTEQIVAEGGDIIDVGAYSTRPGATEVTEEEEMARLDFALPVIRRTVPNALLSIDTFRASVAERCIKEYGVTMVNDISGGSDPNMFPLTARLGISYVLTHNSRSASPATPLRQFAATVIMWFSKQVDSLLSLGQKDIILDPGFGFGKTLEENYELMRQLTAFHTFGLPLLVGVSRKSMIYRLLDCQPEDALNGTTVLHTMALERGAQILRVHDVRACREAIKIVAATNRKP